MKRTLLTIFTLWLMTAAAFAHGGEDHGGGAPAATKSGMTAQMAAGEDVEALFKYPTLGTGKESRLFVFVTDKRSNRPVTGLEIIVTMTDPTGKEVRIPAKAGDLPGQYEFTFTPGNPGQYKVRAGLTGKSFTEGFAFAPLVVSAPIAPAANEAPPVWLLVLSGALAVLAAVLVFGPRRHTNEKQPHPQPL